ncbi:NAD(P)-binding protein [Tothia fuscella]|uniref:NAD(P)-binding protein n=1 Tax=Tothia fuscella TaxID=1048955 RepID=A0A9P4TSA3_9PEZI|nr:NAD(P)-binding protein [Tothia fuscella]
MMETIKQTIAQNLTGGNKVANPEDQFTVDQVPDQSGKVAVVTGGSEGIGYGCTHTLLSKNISKLYILSPTKEVVEGAMDALKSEMGDDVAKRVQWLQCDLGDWNQAADMAKKISNSTDRLDILLNNAARGIMTAQLTPSRVDQHMALNHIGHVVLTSHLLPLMKKTAENGNTVRIVNQGSNAHEQAPKDVKFESLEEINKDCGPTQQYGKSKLAVMLHTKYLARHLASTHPNILANCTHPGIIDSKQTKQDILEAYPLGGYLMKYGMAPFRKNQFEGCIPMMFAGTKTEKSGQYICPPAIVEEGSPLYNDEQLGESLMKLTRELVKQKTQAAENGCPLKDY